MPRGGSRVGAGRPRKPDSVRSLAAAKRAAKSGADPKKVALPTASRIKPDAVGSDASAQSVIEQKEPLDYMLAVMNDPSADAARRDRMAVAAAPYLHPKVAEAGKKQQRSAAAKTAGAGRFAPAAPPKLVVSNR